MTTRRKMATVAAAAALAGTTAATQSLPDKARLEAMTARFAQVNIEADVSRLPDAERTALVHILEAARLMDGLFLRQVWAGNPSLLMRLAADSSPEGRARLRYFLINKGAWSQLDHDEPFVPGVPAKPKQAGYYPADATKAEVEAWLASLPDEQRDEATGFFTTIRRGPGGALRTVPYSLEYQDTLILAADHLKAAAAATAQPTLKAYLAKRAEAFLSNDYYSSDVAWMELDASIEPTIGPYETYEDGWFNAKAGFEAFIALRDEAETAKLAKFSGELQALEDQLPIPAPYRSPTLGTLAPIRVVNVIFTAGDANSGVQTAAYNLPNDERVVREKGAKRVMLKNVQEAKFSTVLLPIAKVVLPVADQARVSFDAFFTHILMHELMHGLGPRTVMTPGISSTVRQALKETYSAIEEAKADVSGLWALQKLIDKGVVDRSLEATMYTTFLASMFRSIRFGVTEAHGLGIAIQLNRFLDEGAVKIGSDGRFSFEPERLKVSITKLSGDLMTLQAEGRYDVARKMFDDLGVVRPEIQAVLAKLTDIPVDIEPRFVTAEALLSGR